MSVASTVSRHPVTMAGIMAETEVTTEVTTGEMRAVTMVIMAIMVTAVIMVIMEIMGTTETTATTGAIMVIMAATTTILVAVTALIRGGMEIRAASITPDMETSEIPAPENR